MTSTHTTQLYDRRADEVTLDEVERVLIEISLGVGKFQAQPDDPADRCRSTVTNSAGFSGAKPTTMLTIP